MSLRPETFIRKFGLIPFYNRLDTPENLRAFEQGKVFKTDGIRIDPHNLGLAFISLMQQPRWFKTQKDTIVAETGVSPQLLSLAYNAITHGAVEKMMQEKQNDLNALFLYLCTIVSARNLSEIVNLSGWGANVRLKQTLEKLQRNTRSKEHKKYSISQFSFKKKMTLAALVIQKGKHATALRRLRRGESIQRVLGSMRFDANSYYRLRDQIDLYGLRTDTYAHTPKEKREQLFRQIDTESDHKKVGKSLSQVGWGSVRVKTNKGGPVVFFKDLITEAGGNNRKKRWRYKKIVAAFDSAKIGVGILKKPVHVKRKNGIVLAQQREYIARRNDSEKAIRIIRRLIARRII